MLQKGLDKKAYKCNAKLTLIFNCLKILHINPMAMLFHLHTHRGYNNVTLLFNFC